MRGKELNDEQREQILGAYLAGVKGPKISSKLGIAMTTVYDTINRYKKTGTPHPEKRFGRPATLSERGKWVLQRVIYDNRFAPLGEITSQLNSNLSTTYHPNTVRKYLHEIEFKSYTARKKSLLTNQQRIAQLHWCQAKHHWTEEWKNIVWSDESRFALFKSDGRVKVWRRHGETYNANCVKPTTKFGGGSVMFWGCFSWHGVGPLVVVKDNMDSDVYVNILSNYYIPWVSHHPNLIFQQDGASCHTSHYTSWWMSTHYISVLDWTAQSPDLNPIEHLWDHLDTQIRKKNPPPLSQQDLISAIQEEWANIKLETLQNLILSLPNRVNAIIKAKGRHTQY